MGEIIGIGVKRCDDMGDWGALRIRNVEALAASGPGAGRMEHTEFADGTVWSEAELRVRTFTGTAGNDRIQGWCDDDVIDGGVGNDTLNGGNGADTYVLR